MTPFGVVVSMESKGVRAATDDVTIILAKPGGERGADGAGTDQEDRGMRCNDAQKTGRRSARFLESRLSRI